LRRTVKSSELLAGGNELLIEHNGGVYSLRQTSNGKLILTK
jgi:hemin uptake protein HemP